MYYSYVLRSLKDKKLYIGFTNNLKRRLKQHQNGLCESTKNRVPFEMIYFEKFEDRSDAANREKFFKSGKGREFLKRVIQ
jgi:putative endonuclease